MHLYREGHRQRSRILYVFRSPGGVRVGRRGARSRGASGNRSAISRHRLRLEGRPRSSAAHRDVSGAAPAEAAEARRALVGPSRTRSAPLAPALPPAPAAPAPSAVPISHRRRHARRSDRVSRALVRDHSRAHSEADVGSRPSGSAAGADRTTQSCGVDRCRSDRRGPATGIRGARAAVTRVLAAAPSSLAAVRRCASTVTRSRVIRHLERPHRVGRARRGRHWGHGDPSCSSWPISSPR